MAHDHDPYYSAAATALNEATRLEEVRFDRSAENWQQQLAGLAMVIGSSARLADCLADHLAGSTQRAAWRADRESGDQAPDELLAGTALAVQRVAEQLATAAETLTTAAGDLAGIQLTPDNGAA